MAGQLLPAPLAQDRATARGNAWVGCPQIPASPSWLAAALGQPMAVGRRCHRASVQAKPCRVCRQRRRR